MQNGDASVALGLICRGGVEGVVRDLQWRAEGVVRGLQLGAVDMLGRGFKAGLLLHALAGMAMEKRVKFMALGVGGGGLSAGLWAWSVGTRQRAWRARALCMSSVGMWTGAALLRHCSGCGKKTSVKVCSVDKGMCMSVKA